MHRVRVGALGLAGVFLLVMLATAFLRGASGPDNATMRAGNGIATAPAEPLAQLGVAPGGDDPAPATHRPAHSKARH